MDLTRKQRREKLAIDVIEDYGNSNVGLETIQDLTKKDWVEIMLTFVCKVADEENQEILQLVPNLKDKLNKRISNESFIKGLSHTNDRLFVLIKAAEECGELNIALLQSITKPDQYDPMSILSEIADVEIQLIALKELFLNEGYVGGNIDLIITNQTNKKIEKLKKYKANIKNFGKIQNP